MSRENDTGGVIGEWGEDERPQHSWQKKKGYYTVFPLIVWKWISQSLSTDDSLSKLTKPKPKINDIKEETHNIRVHPAQMEEPEVGRVEEKESQMEEVIVSEGGRERERERVVEEHEEKLGDEEE